MDIKSRAFWFKVVDFLQQNWALVDENADGTCTVFFMNDAGGVFDQMIFPSVEQANEGLYRNGFELFADDKKAQEFLRSPEGPYIWSDHPNGRIYSSGRYWH